MYYTIYQITNKLDGKIYIGKRQTNNLDDDYMGSGKHIIRAQKGNKNSQYGTCWITNGVINKKHKVIDNIPEGWYKGRVI